MTRICPVLQNKIKRVENGIDISRIGGMVKKIP
jgi:hypothetical protein